MTRVLSGYRISPAGETCVGGFTAGYKKVNPSCVLMVSAMTSILAELGVAGGFIDAVERGNRINSDLSANWDCWPLLPFADHRGTGTPRDYLNAQAKGFSAPAILR